MKKKLLALTMALCLSLGMIIHSSAADYTVKQLEGGPSCSFVLTNDGTLYACGQNHQGILGPDAGAHDPIQGLVAKELTKIAEDVKEVAASETPTLHYYKNPYEQGYHVLILMENGDLYAQGDNLYAQLGQYDRNPYEGMQFVMSDVKAIAAGSYFSACVTEEENGAVLDLYVEYYAACVVVYKLVGKHHIVCKEHVDLSITDHMLLTCASYDGFSTLIFRHSLVDLLKIRLCNAACLCRFLSGEVENKALDRYA